MANEANTKKKDEPAAGNVGAKPEEKPKAKGASNSGWWQNLKDLLAPIIGVGLLVFYIVFLLSLRANINAEETQWMRWIYLLNGVEAIAFAAAGYFFGSEVNRKAAENAKQDAENSKNDAADANNRATGAEKDAVKANANGRALTAVISAKSKGHQTRSGSYGKLGAEDVVGIGKADLNELADLAKQLFP
jgi:hypothetical protein